MINKNQQVTLYTKILDALPFYVMLVDSEHNIIFINKITRKALNMNLDKIIGSYCPKVVHNSDKPIEGCPLEEAVKTKNIIEKEIYDSKLKRWIFTSIYPTGMKTEKGSEIYLHYAKDITDKKQKEEQINLQKEELQSRNIALKEMLENTIIEKKDIEEKIIANLNKLILPKLKLLEKRGNKSDKQLLNLIEKNMDNICSSFSKNIINKELNLSPRELEICDMIKNGLKSTDIAKELKLSLETIETTRKKIRKKLKLQNKKINLQTFLKNI